MEDWLLFGLIEFNKKLLQDLRLIWVIMSLVGDFMIEFMFNEVREHLFVQRTFHVLIDELIRELIVICVCMCMFNGLGNQALEKDRGKQPETSNK